MTQRIPRPAFLVAFAVALALAIVSAERVDAQGKLLALENIDTVTCATTATAIVPASGLNYSSLYCENNSATSVFYGGSNVTTSSTCVSTATGTCPRGPSFSFEAVRGQPYCRVAAGTVALKCVVGGP